MLRIHLDHHNFSIFLSLSAMGMLLVCPHGKYGLVFDHTFMSNNRERHVLFENSSFILGFSSAYWEIRPHLLFRYLIQNP